MGRAFFISCEIWRSASKVSEIVRDICEKCSKSKRARFDSDGLVRKFLDKLGISEESLENVVGVISDEEYRKLMSTLD